VKEVEFVWNSLLDEHKFRKMAILEGVLS